MPTLLEDKRVNSKPDETLSENGAVHQNTEDDEPMTDKQRPQSRRRIGWIYSAAVLLTFVLFYFYVVVIFDVIGEMSRYKAWLLARMGEKDAGKLLLLGVFFALLAAHLIQAAAWGLFLRRTRLLPSMTEASYFSGASITTLGYGDILLKYPWRHLGTLIAVSGVLMFGCSTAFLFVILQSVWQDF